MKYVKNLIVVGLLLGLALAMTACGGKPFTCDLCMEEKSGKKHTSDFYGEKITICDECYKGINELFGN